MKLKLNFIHPISNHEKIVFIAVAVILSLGVTAFIEWVILIPALLFIFDRPNFMIYYKQIPNILETIGLSSGGPSTLLMGGSMLRRYGENKLGIKLKKPDDSEGSC